MSQTFISVVLILFSFQLSAGFGFGSNKMAPPATVKKALANPRGYQFDDGGSISFGNGISKRRFNFKGKAQVCHRDNLLVAGKSMKCVSPVLNKNGVKVGCKKQKLVELTRKMRGRSVICLDEDREAGARCKRPATVRVNKGPKVKTALYRKAQMNGDNPQAGFLGFTILEIPKCSARSVGA